MQATWPHNARWTAAAPRMIGEVLSRQQSIGGAETVIPGMGARWEISGSFLIHGEVQELAWQAFIAQMEGGLGTTLVPVWSRFRPRMRDGRVAPWNNAGALVGGGSRNDGSDGQTWEHFGFVNAPVVTMALAEPAPLRATTVRVTGPQGVGLRPGQFFSIGERLHRVQNHWQDGAGVSNLMIQPPLRRAFSTAALILDRPVCRMRLAAAEGDLEYSPDVASRVTCRFVEAI